MTELIIKLGGLVKEAPAWLRFALGAGLLGAVAVAVTDKKLGPWGIAAGVIMMVAVGFVLALFPYVKERHATGPLRALLWIVVVAFASGLALAVVAAALSLVEQFSAKTSETGEKRAPEQPREPTQQVAVQLVPADSFPDAKEFDAIDFGDCSVAVYALSGVDIAGATPVSEARIDLASTGLGKVRLVPSRLYDFRLQSCGSLILTKARLQYDGGPALKLSVAKVARLQDAGGKGDGGANHKPDPDRPRRDASSGNGNHEEVRCYFDRNWTRLAVACGAPAPVRSGDNHLPSLRNRHTDCTTFYSCQSP